MFHFSNGNNCCYLPLFEELVKRHEEVIYRVAYRLCGNHEDAEDLVQESLLEAYRSFRGFKEGSYFDRWMFRIVRNTFIDGVRRRPRINIESLDSQVEDYRACRNMDQSEDRFRPEHQLLSSVLDEPIQAALMSLPSEFRLALVLCDMESLTYDEAARAMNCPVGTVRSRLHRARLLMKERLTPIYSATR